MKYGPERFPQQIKDARKFLNGKMEFDSTHSHGQENSKADEKTMIRLLKDEYGEENVIKPPKKKNKKGELIETRTWWDVKLFGYPIQIKSSDFTSADNFNCKGGILYALSQLDESKCDYLHRKSWNKWIEALKNCRELDNDRDLYIFTANKKNGEVFLTSVKSLRKLTPNHNNMPFQVRWKPNIKPVPRTHEEAYDFLTDAYRDSVKNFINAHRHSEDLQKKGIFNYLKNKIKLIFHLQF